MVPGADQVLRLLPRSALLDQLRDYLLDCATRRLSGATIARYERELSAWRLWLEARGVTDAQAVTAPLLRAYMAELAGHHNAGGQHLAYRTLRAFLRWYEREYEPQGWANPCAKVRPPKLPDEMQPTLSLDHLRRMLATCSASQDGRRARAILLCLLDTGCRASEFCGLNVGDVDMDTGAVLVRRGKGGKDRVTFLGHKSRRALLRYLRGRGPVSEDAPLWTRKDGGRLTYWGLRQVIRWRAHVAGVPEPSRHSFRRAFALGCLQNGADVVSLSRLLGHADLSLVRRYARQTQDDLQRAHRAHSPVDNLL